MKTKQYIHSILVIALTAFLPGACTEHEMPLPDIPSKPLPQQPTTEPAEQEVVFSVFIPKERHTRALTDDDENTVDVIDVLAFNYNDDDDEWQYAYHAQGSETSGDGTSSQLYSVTAWTLSAEQKFVIITNAASEVAALIDTTAPGTEKDAMLSKLQLDISGTDGTWNTGENFKKLPAWGESDPIVITRETQSISNEDILLLRMVARIDVELDATYPAKTIKKFQLTSVRLYNYQAHGSVVPDSENRTSTGTVTHPSIPINPDTNQPYVPVKGPAVYDEDIIGNSAMIRAIYALESKSPDRLQDATCLVVGGRYSATGSFTGVSESFYRVDFVTDDDTRLDILRNHHYQFKISEVSGVGYDTPEVALVSKSMNITAEIKEWNIAGMGNLVFDGSSVLAISSDRFTFYRNEERTTATTDNLLDVYTDYVTTDATYPSGWYISSVNELSDDGTVGTNYTDFDDCWLKLSLADGTPMGIGTGTDNANVQVHNDKKTLVLKFERMPETQIGARSVKIVFAAGRLQYPVIVTQADDYMYEINLSYTTGTDGIEKPLENGGTLSFMAGKGKQPSRKILKVNWVPADADVSVKVNAVGTGFASTIITDGTLTSENGSKNYDMMPSALDENETDGRMAIVTFTLRNGNGGAVVKTLMLRQQEYAYQLENKPALFLMNDDTYNLKVKSNVNWQAEIVDDPAGILHSFTDSGNANTQNGSNLAIKFNDFIECYTANPEAFSDVTLPDVKLRIYHMEDGEKIELREETLHATPLIAKATAAVSPISNKGGSSVAYEILGKNTYQWSLQVAPTVDSDESLTRKRGETKLKVVNHFATVTDDADTELTNYTTLYDTGEKIKIKLPVVQFPNRLIPNIHAEAQLYLNIEGTPVKIPNAVITVQQEELKPRTMKVWSRLVEWGSFFETDGADYFGPQRRYMLSKWIPRYDWSFSYNLAYNQQEAEGVPEVIYSGVTPPEGFNPTYIQLGFGNNANLHPSVDLIHSYIQDGDVPAMYVPVSYESASLSNANARLPGYFAGSAEQSDYNVIAGNIGDTYKLNTDTETINSLVYKFVMGAYDGNPLKPATTIIFDGNDGIDGVKTVLSKWPSTAIPLIKHYDYSNIALLTIDPTTNVIYMGENTTIRNVPITVTESSASEYKLFANLVEYITLSAEYGKLFTDLLIGTETSNPKDLWDSVWGDNIYPY
jgi:hypothetical protein